MAVVVSLVDRSIVSSLYAIDRVPSQSHAWPYQDSSESAKPMRDRAGRFLKTIGSLNRRDAQHTAPHLSAARAEAFHQANVAEYRIGERH